MKAERPKNDVIFVATLSPAAEAERRSQWIEFFGACHVPVVDDQPQRTLLPNGTTQDCVFIDFSVGGPALKDRILDAFQRRTTHPLLEEMLANDTYPVRLADVTVVKAPRRLWAP